MKYFINNGNTTDVLLYSFLKSEVKQILNQLFTFFTAYKMAYVCIEYIIIIIITGCLPFFVDGRYHLPECIICIQFNSILLRYAFVYIRIYSRSVGRCVQKRYFFTVRKRPRKTKTFVRSAAESHWFLCVITRNSYVTLYAKHYIIITLCTLYVRNTVVIK